MMTSALGPSAAIIKSHHLHQFRNILIDLEKEIMLIIHLVSQPRKINMMIYLMIFSLNKKRRVIKERKLYNLIVVLILIQLTPIPLILKKLKNGVLLIFNLILMLIHRNFQWLNIHPFWMIKIVRIIGVIKVDLQASKIIFS